MRTDEPLVNLGPWAATGQFGRISEGGFDFDCEPFHNRVFEDRVLQSGTFGHEPSILASSEGMNTDLFTKRNTTQEKTRRLADTKASVIGDTLIAKGNQVTIDISHWQEQSACRQADPEMFFPIGSTGSALDRIHIAKMLCESCKVTETCLNYALETNQEAGVWGGYAEDERRRLRKRWLAERRKARIGV